MPYSATRTVGPVRNNLSFGLAGSAASTPSVLSLGLLWRTDRLAGNRAERGPGPGRAVGLPAGNLAQPVAVGSESSMIPVETESDRRHPSRGNPLSDLCLVLERARRQACLTSLALADAQGLLIAGAGQFAQCEELGALAALGCDRPADGVVRFELLGAEVLLCAPSDALDHAVAERVRLDCTRVLGRVRRLN